MTLSLSELLLIDPATASDSPTFDGWTLAQGGEIKAAASVACDIAYGFSQETRGLCTHALAVFSQWLAMAAPSGALDLDIPLERRRGEIAQLRIFLQMIRFFTDLAEVIRTPLAPHEHRRWPGMPVYIPLKEKPRVRITPPVGTVQRLGGCRRERYDLPGT